MNLNTMRSDVERAEDFHLSAAERVSCLAFVAENTTIPEPAATMADKPDIIVAMVFHQVRASIPHTDAFDRHASLAWLRAVGFKPLQFPLPMPSERAKRYRLPAERREEIMARIVAIGRCEMEMLVDMDDGDLELAFHKVLPCLPDTPEKERAAHLEWLGARGMRPHEIPVSPEAAQAMGFHPETGTAPSWVEGPPTTDPPGWRNMKAYLPAPLPSCWRITKHRSDGALQIDVGARTVLVMSGGDQRGEKRVRVTVAHHHPGAIDIAVLSNLRGVGRFVELPESYGQRHLYAPVAWN